MEPLRPSLYPLPWVASLWAIVIEVEADRSSAMMPVAQRLYKWIQVHSVLPSHCARVFLKDPEAYLCQKLDMQDAAFPVDS